MPKPGGTQEARWLDAIKKALRQTTQITKKQVIPEAKRIFAAIVAMNGLDFQAQFGKSWTEAVTQLKVSVKGATSVLAGGVHRLYTQGLSGEAVGATKAATAVGVTEAAATTGKAAAAGKPGLLSLEGLLGKGPAKFAKASPGLAGAMLLPALDLFGARKALGGEHRAKLRAIEAAGERITPEAILDDLKQNELIAEGRARYAKKDPVAFEILTRMMAGEGSAPRLTANEQLIYAGEPLSPQMRAGASDQLTRALMGA